MIFIKYLKASKDLKLALVSLVKYGSPLIDKQTIRGYKEDRSKELRPERRRYVKPILYGYECSQRVPLVYEPKPCYNQSFGDNTYPHDSPCDEFIKSSVKNLVPNQSESKDACECNVPACDDFTTFFNLLFDADDDFSSSDNESFFDEDISKEIYSNPLFDEEIISIEIDPHHFNVESDLIESLLNHDSLIISSSLKIDSLLDEFVGELILLKSIPPRIDKTDCDPEEEIPLIEKFLYDNSSPRPPKEFISKNSDAEIKSFSPSPIPVEDSDSLMKEIDLTLTLDDSMPPGIEEEDYESERDMLILDELLSNNYFSFPENESFHFDIPSSPRPPVKPSDDDEIEPNSGILTVKVSNSNLRSFKLCDHNRNSDIQFTPRWDHDPKSFLRNNVVPLRSDTFRLVQNGFSFHELRSEDPNPHLKDFLKLVDSLDLDDENKERTRLRLFQFSLRNQASNWLERLPTGSITTWEDLTTRESISEAWTHFKDLLQKVPHHGIDLWLQVQIFYDHVNPVIRRTINQSAGGKLRDRNAEELSALLEDLAIYDNESLNNPRDFAKPVKV
nr:zinc finger, CCHC-type [Tanacetum cinerariifolium]